MNILKEFKALPSIFVFAVLCFGCNNHLLNHDPELGLDQDLLIQDEKGAQTALNGLYSLLKDENYYGGVFPMMSDLSSDISQSVGTFDEYLAMDMYKIAPTLVRGVGDLWVAVYRVINQANFIIEKAPEVEDIDPDTLDQILGEAYFIRGLAYFDLTRSFGGVEGVYGSLGVPIVLKPTLSSEDIDTPSRSSINESYRQVEDDLLQAESLLNSPNDPERVSKAAAQALLSRLYMYYKMDFDLVDTYATDVIEDYDYQLNTNYEAIFKDGGTSETIFELFSSTDEQSQFFYYYAPASVGGRNEFKLHDRLVDFLQSRPGDVRANLVQFSDDAGAYWPIKYAKSNQSDNVQMLRIAEMYLNRAEARVRKDSPDLPGALSDLNRIRNRAGLSDTTGVGVDSSEKILEAIEKERMAEFFEEGHRWFNLLRTGRAMTVLQDIKRTTGPAASMDDPYEQVWPIPSTDRLNNSNLEQNPGY